MCIICVLAACKGVGGTDVIGKVFLANTLVATIAFHQPLPAFGPNYQQKLGSTTGGMAACDPLSPTLSW